MARKQAVDYEEKREAIVDAAARLFAERGFDGASLADLAGACETSKSLIYHYYASKEAILYDVMRGHMDDLLGAIDERPSSKDNPTEALKRFTRELLRRYAGAAARQKVLLYDIDRLSKAEREDIVGKERRLIAHAEALIARRAAEPIDRARLRAATMLYFGMLNWTHNWFRPSGALSRDDLADMAATTILRAIG
jgi:AcrR family transcriptional regulator